MTKFLNLVKSLKAFTVVFIENAFVYEKDSEKNLAKFCFLPEKNRLKILEKLKEFGQHELAQQLANFQTGFIGSNRNHRLENEMPAVEYFKRYLNDIGATGLNEDSVMKLITSVLEDDHDDKIKNSFLKYGIYSSVDEANYEQLIKNIGEIDDISILIYKGQPAEAEKEMFFQEINETLVETKSEFCLAIIDKKLATGDSGAEGKNFISTDIVPRNEKEETKIICCLYTSQPEIQPLEVFAEYFVQEIGKDSPDKYEQMAKTLARSAYAQVFNMLRNQYQRSSDNALRMVLKNQKNIKYIVNHSRQEGIPGFEAIKYWFNLAHQYQFEEDELKSIKLVSNIVSFFDNQYLDNHPQIGKIGPELKKLSYFELFDKNINQKFLPIAPGDIFKVDDDYYILMGQLCDILFRSTNKRKAKLGELLRLSFIDVPDNKEKFSVSVVDGRKSVTIQNFIKEDGSDTNIVIDVSTDTTEFAELAALDMVMFNSTGDAKISLNKGEEIEALKVLPENLVKYYELMQDKFLKLKSIRDAAQTDLTALFDEKVKFSILSFKDNGNGISLEFKRIARLKGKYFDSVYNNFLNNKGRIDLNLVDNSPEHATTVKLLCSFLPDNDSLHVINHANLWSSKGIQYFKKEELISALPEIFMPLLNLYPENIGKGTNQYDLIQNEDGSYSLGLKYLIGEKLFQSKKDYSYKILFSEAKPKTNSDFKVDGDETIYTFLNEAGHASNPISLDQLKKGVTVYEKRLHLQLVKGILIRKDIEE